MWSSTLIDEMGLDGLIELARITKLPIQRCARTSLGTGVSSMQLDVAFQDGYLIPWRKRLPKDFKTGTELLLTDKGGLVFQPRNGFYEQVSRAGLQLDVSQHHGEVQHLAGDPTVHLLPTEPGPGDRSSHLHQMTGAGASNARADPGTAASL